MSKQQKIVAAKAGGPEVLELVEEPVPSPGPGQVLVKVAAVGVNFIETYQRSGVYQVQYRSRWARRFPGPSNRLAPRCAT